MDELQLQSELPTPEEQKENQDKFRENYYKTGLKRYKIVMEPVDFVQDIYIKAQSIVEKVIDQVQPDVILMDQLFNLPFVENKNKPYGMIVSTNPLYAQNLPNYPPAVSFCCRFCAMLYRTTN